MPPKEETPSVAWIRARKSVGRVRNLWASSASSKKLWYSVSIFVRMAIPYNMPLALRRFIFPGEVPTSKMREQSKGEKAKVSWQKKPMMRPDLCYVLLYKCFRSMKDARLWNVLERELLACRGWPPGWPSLWFRKRWAALWPICSCTPCSSHCLPHCSELLVAAGWAAVEWLIWSPIPFAPSSTLAIPWVISPTWLRV